MTTTTCAPYTCWAGPEDCFEGDCEELYDEDSGEPNGLERCSHIKDEQVCALHSTEAPGGFGELAHAEPWPCKHATA